ncbi:MAG: ribosome-recycling factor [Patescibacteria group bacterium]
MHPNITIFIKDAEGHLEHFRKELLSIRAGRATPSLIEHVPVDMYGATQPLQHVASITAPDPRTLIIQPWDKAALEPIRKALESAGLGANPSVQETRVLLQLPPLTEERREEFQKLVGRKAEESRIGIRKSRDSARQAIQADEKEKNISEDEKFRFQKTLQDETDRIIGVLESLEEEKRIELGRI